MPPADPLIIQDVERLTSLRSLRLLDSPTDPAFDRLTALATMILNVPVALVTFVDINRQFFKSQVGLDDPWKTARQMPLQYSFCQHVVAQSAPLIIEDAREHPLVYDNLAVIDLKVMAYAGIPIITSSGQALGSFCVVDYQPRRWTPYEIDILTKLTASVMTEVELRAEIIEREHLLTRITHLEQLKSDMIRVAAHDLQNPLTSMMVYTDLMTRDPLTSKQTSFLREINAATQRMSHMIRDILSLERIEAQAAGGSEAVDFKHLVQEVFKWHCSSAQEKAQTYTLTLPDQTVMLQGDSTQLQEALDNLISNAIKYTPPAGRIQVCLTADRRFEVQDSGYGIPKDQQPKLFAPFFRAHSHETQDIAGTGLGLHLVKRIIERHGGQIIFHSEYGKGSTFGFHFS